MGKTSLPSQSSLRFFSTFHRYMTATSIPHHHPLPPLSLNTQPRPSSHLSRRPYASISTATASTPPPQPESQSTTQPSEQPKTHYTLFPLTLPRGPPPSGPFTISPSHLRREFLSLQSLYHPDRHPSSSPSEKSRIEATSAHFNSAYRTLLDPLLRAQYLLSLHGIDVAEDETAKEGDMELLEEVMEVRSAVDAAGTEGEVEEVRRANEERIRVCEGRMGEAFEGGDLEGARREVVRLRYWRNVRESVEGWEEGRGGGNVVH